MQAEAEKLRTKSKYDKFDKLKRDGGDGVSTDYMQLAGEIITRRKEFEALLDEVQMNVRDVHADDPQDEQDDIVVDMLNDRIRETFDSMSLPHEWKHTGVAVKIPGVVVNLLRDPQHLPKRGEDVAEEDEMMRMAGRKTFASLYLEGLSVDQFDGGAKYVLQNTVAAALGLSPQAVKVLSWEEAPTKGNTTAGHVAFTKKGRPRQAKRAERVHPNAKQKVYPTCTIVHSARTYIHEALHTYTHTHVHIRTGAILLGRAPDFCPTRHYSGLLS